MAKAAVDGGIILDVVASPAPGPPDQAGRLDARQDRAASEQGLLVEGLYLLSEAAENACRGLPSSGRLGGRCGATRWQAESRDGTARKEERRVGMVRGEARLGRITARGDTARARHVGNGRF